MSNNNTNNNNKESSEKEKELWFGGYRGGLIRWNTMRKQSRYTSRYKNNRMMRRILSTTISN